MAKYKVTMGKISAIGLDGELEVRTLTREFGTAKAAAELACDLLYVLEGRPAATAHTDKYYLVSRDRPRVEYRSSGRDFWVEVLWVPVGGQGVDFTRSAA